MYRSSVLARYKDEEIFQEIIKTTGIKTIIDLRAPEEKMVHFYGNLLDKFEINYISFPLGQKKIDEQLKFKYSNENDDYVFYNTGNGYLTAEQMNQREIEKINQSYKEQLRKTNEFYKKAYDRNDLRGEK